MSNKAMSAEARAAAALYQREYRRLHPDKAKQYRINYWNKKAKEQQEKDEGGQE